MLRSARRAAAAVVATDSSSSESESDGISNEELETAGPERKVPDTVLAFTILAVGLIMALVMMAILTLDYLLILPKFRLFQKLIGDAGLAVAVLVLVGLSSAMVGAAALFVELFHRSSAGSGLPELKAYVNGNRIPGHFGRRNWVRAAGTILATGGGLPTGREGPLVTIGGSVGAGTMNLLGGRVLRRWSKLNTETSTADVNQLAALKRTGVVMGGAAGLAAAFNAPIGGVLYMLEEVTVSVWSSKMTTQTLATTIIATFSMVFLLGLAGDKPHSLVIFDHLTNYQEDSNWGPVDLPFFAVTGAVGGLLSAAYTTGLVWVFQYRSRRSPLWHRQPTKILEAVAFAAICAAVFATFPLLYKQHCRPTPGDDVKHGRIFNQFLCEAGEHNELATLLLQGEEGAVKHLFNQDQTMEPLNEILPLALAFVAYFPMTVALAGISVPTGNFIPCMFLGALVGRSLRLALGVLDLNLAVPGVYALQGSAGVLGGFLHMTIAIAVLLVEMSKDINMAAPLLLSIGVGRWVSKQLVPHDYCEQLIALKGVPYLEADCPAALQGKKVTAGGLCEQVPEDALLPPEASHSRVRAALLACPQLRHFPVESRDGTAPCAGLVSRSRLEAGLHGHVHLAVEDDVEEDTEEIENSSWTTSRPRLPSDVSPPPESQAAVEDEAAVINVLELADPAAHFVLESVAMEHIYKLFSQAGASAVCVLGARCWGGGGFGAAPGPAVIGVLERRHVADKAPVHR